MKASDYIAETLQKRGVTHVFELVGGMITFLLDALARQPKIQIVSMHHEQGAGFAAEGFGRMTGVPGVAMATSGPGATNLLTAIGSCYFDSTPAVFITGQVNTHEQKGDRKIRQLGFQETDIVAMARPITKAAWLLNDVRDLPSAIDAAFSLARHGRPGPVLIDIPMDVQRGEVPSQNGTVSLSPDSPIDDARIRDYWATACEAITHSERPLVLVGGGVRSSNSVAVFREFADRLDVPVVNSLMGVDAIPAQHRNRVGMIGSYGNRWANIAIAESDLLLVLGSRLDVRQTGSDTESFHGNRQVFHVDCTAGEINNRVVGCHPLVTTLDAFFRSTSGCSSPKLDINSWRNRLADLQAQWPDTEETPDNDGINPNQLMRSLSAASRQSAAFVVDVGQHQMWAAQSLQLNADQRFVTSGGMGAMGFALPAAIGACCGSGGKPIVVIAGDGGFQLNIQELQTVRRLELPIKMVVLNNQCHGMVRQFQESFFKGRYQSTLWGYSAPSFMDVASAYGFHSAHVANPDDVPTALDHLWRDPDRPFLLKVAIDQFLNAYPKMAFGRAISEMEPLAKPIEMEGT